MSKLYFGDNLTILRQQIPAESVDLIYLDPPFNSKRGYNLFFKAPSGQISDAQITAFDDTWQWGEQAEQEYLDLLRQPNTDVAELIDSFRRFLKENDMMAYLTMMASRLLELHRVLKPMGSLYLHCDPTASHYLKILLDAVFGKTNYRTEISWKRSAAHSDAKQGRKQYGNIRDIIFFYTKSDEWTWNQQHTSYSEEYLRKMYRYVEPETGRIYRLDNLTGPGGAAKGNPSYEVMGVTRHWRYSKENMDKLIEEGRVVQVRPGAVPSYKRYLDEMPGVALQNDWPDISPPSGKEFLGYPTQKPLALLERIILTSSNAGDVVLDPFCGCGTAVHASQKLGRDWLGIDITHLAIHLIEKRMKSAFPGLPFEVLGTPKDLAGARDLFERDEYEFQWWACALVDAQPYKGKKKGADKGIDGLIYFQDDKGGAKKIVVSVKGGKNIGRAMIADLKNTVEREKAHLGLFVTLTPPTKPMTAEAASAGFYESPKYGAYPKIQILTIEGLLLGQEAPRYPDLSRGGLTFRKAQREQGGAEQGELF